jgi:hypothetical protein
VFKIDGLLCARGSSARVLGWHTLQAKKLPRRRPILFCYNFKVSRWRYRLGVRTEDSQSSNPGSIPGSATKITSCYLPLSAATACTCSGWSWAAPKRVRNRGIPWWGTVAASTGHNLGHSPQLPEHDQEPLVVSALCSALSRHRRGPGPRGGGHLQQYSFANADVSPSESTELLAIQRSFVHRSLKLHPQWFAVKGGLSCVENGR